jgi:hypothetical protein
MTLFAWRNRQRWNGTGDKIVWTRWRFVTESYKFLPQGRDEIDRKIRSVIGYREEKSTTRKSANIIQTSLLHQGPNNLSALQPLPLCVCVCVCVCKKMFSLKLLGFASTLKTDHCRNPEKTSADLNPQIKINTCLLSEKKQNKIVRHLPCVTLFPSYLSRYFHPYPESCLLSRILLYCRCEEVDVTSSRQPHKTRKRISFPITTHSLKANSASCIQFRLIIQHLFFLSDKFCCYT